MKRIVFLLFILAIVLSKSTEEKICINKTKELSCSDFNEMYYTIDEAIRALRPDPKLAYSDPSTNLLAGKIIAGIVRLAFHDAVEYDPNSKDKLKFDGCVNPNDPGNAGLNRVIPFVNKLWSTFCDKISRADFWFLTAKVAIETSTPYVDYENTLGCDCKKKRNHCSKYPEITCFNIPFYYGRESSDNCSYTGPSRLPSAEATPEEYRRVFFDHLGLNTRETTALIGAHTLGSVSVTGSGYNGNWKRRIDLFDTGYFHQLVANKWKVQLLMGPAGKIFNQWVIENSTTKNDNIMMLNTDLDMLYSIDPKTSRDKRPMCGPYDPKSKKDVCTHIDTSPYKFHFNYYALKYSEGYGVNKQDLPGSARFLRDYAIAFNKICSVGYKPGELTCAECTTPTCLKCDKKELCEGPQYGKFPSHDEEQDECDHH